MNVADKSLCQELWKLSGWGGKYKNETEFMWCEDYTKPLWAQDNIKAIIDAPAYDLGFILRKLPANSWVGKCIEEWESPYAAHIGPEDEFNQNGDTPENAAVKLAIELFKQGVLTKGGN